jgi:hypothetical protein
LKEGTKKMTLQANTEFETEAGTLEAVWLIEVQTRPDDTSKILNKVMEVDPLIYGRYERNCFISAVGTETYLPQANSTSAVHLGAEGKVQTFPSVVMVLSIPQRNANLPQVIDAIRAMHHYEEPLIFVSECWASRAKYNPHNKNPNRWWNERKS